MRIAIATLGCKANQYDSQVIGASLKEKDFSPVHFTERADVYIINTCTVTKHTDYQSRQLIRRAYRTNPDAKIIVTGCYAQVAPDEVKKLPGVSLVVGNFAKAQIADLIAELEPEQKPRVVLEPLGPENTFAPDKTANISGRTRFFLKIQDGCNASCSYCIIPRARGPSRSINPKKVLETIQTVGSSGYKEVILTGIHLGAYGLDLEPPSSLNQLLAFLEKEKPVPRLRLSSIEPIEIDDGLIHLMANSRMICPHLHIPMQSGDNTILRRMNRAYSSAVLRSLILKLKDSILNVAIGADLIVGFPGEGDDEFQRTLDLVEALPITYLHVFPFSPRPGTPAAEFRERVNGTVVQERGQVLRALSGRKKEAFYRTYLRRSALILIEGKRDRRTGLLKGLSRNYIPVLIEGGDELINQEVAVTITSVQGGIVQGAVDGAARIG